MKFLCQSRFVAASALADAGVHGKPHAGNPHVRFDEEDVAPCTVEASLRRVPCRRQPEGRASGCAATPRRGSLLYTRIITTACMLTCFSAFAYDKSYDAIYTAATGYVALDADDSGNGANSSFHTAKNLMVDFVASIDKSLFWSFAHNYTTSVLQMQEWCPMHIVPCSRREAA